MRAADDARPLAVRAFARTRFPYLRWGIAAGAVGAAAVALFFLAVDAIAGRPLATPSALGATLFLGEPFDLDRPPQAVLILAYTLVHTGLFVGFSTAASAFVLGGGRHAPRGVGRLAVLLAAVFFGGTTLACLAMSIGFALPMWSGLGAGRVAGANALAALAMAGVLAAAFRRRRGATAPQQRPDEAPLAPSLAARRREGGAAPIDSRGLQAPPAGRAEAVEEPKRRSSRGG